MADYDKAIPPGQEGKIAIKIDGKKLPTAFFEKTFSVKTNDPDNASFNITVQGNVKKVFELSHEIRWAGFVDEDFKMESVITNLLSTPIRITGIKWADEVKAKALDEKLGTKIETIEKGKKYRLKIWKKKALSPETIATNVVLTTDHPKLREKHVPVSITIMKDVELQPEKLYYGEMVIPAGATKPFERTFTIVTARGDSLKILNAFPSRDDVTVKIQEVKPGKLYRGTVWVRPTSRLGQYTASIKIQTNYKNYEELVLSIVGSVRVGESSASGSPAKGKK